MYLCHCGDSEQDTQTPKLRRLIWSTKIYLIKPPNKPQRYIILGCLGWVLQICILVPCSFPKNPVVPMSKNPIQPMSYDCFWQIPDSERTYMVIKTDTQMLHYLGIFIYLHFHHFQWPFFTQILHYWYTNGSLGIINAESMFVWWRMGSFDLKYPPTV